MTYNTHPTYGVAEVVFGAAEYAMSQYKQRTVPTSAQSASIGNSESTYTIEGFEKTIYPKPNTIQTSFGAADYINAQTLQQWDNEVKAAAAEGNEEENH